ncbi:MAG: hypothetical protein OXT67_12965 [Zetaproteobacteria bacterium]|nr:hypothetical protein [Zetaproteobacteria bacterium]
MQLHWNKRVFMKWFGWLLVCVSLSACTKYCSKSPGDYSPEEVVEHYLELALNVTRVEQKAEMMEWTSGDLASALAQATDETFKGAYIDRKYDVQRFSIVRRADQTPRETEITYLLVYKDLGKGGVAVEEATLVEVENTVSLMKSKGRWLIDEVVGSKTTFDFAVTEESKIEASAP